MIEDLQSDKTLTRTLFNNFGKLLVFVFYSNTNQESCKVKESVLSMIPLFGQFSNVKYFSISLEKCPEISKKYTVEYTPTIILTQTDKKIRKRLQSDDVGIIFDTISQESESLERQFQAQKKVWHPKIKSILQQSAVIVFIKGTAQNPKCGFTQTLINLLRSQNIQFTYYDILADEYMRYWLRNYAGWPTYPQIYSQGKLIGGLDLCKQLVSKGQFLQLIPPSSRLLSVQEKFNQLLIRNKYLILIDGFSFQKKQIQQFISIAEQKFNDQKIWIINVNLDKKMKQYLQIKKIILPAMFVEGVQKIL